MKCKPLTPYLVRGTAPLFGDRIRCVDCQRDWDEREAYYTKQIRFNQAQTVEELKDWIREYML